MNPPPSPPPDANKENEKRENLLEAFRAYLHLVITAHQTNQSNKLDGLPGPQVFGYCLKLSELPDNILTTELMRPLKAILNQISDVSMVCETLLHRTDAESVALHASARRALDQIDFAFYFILREFHSFVENRAQFTRCGDFLCEFIFRIAIGEGANAADLIRRYMRDFPEDGRDENGLMQPDSFPHMFAWDVYQRVEALDRLADEFPDHIGTAACRMHAWPMLMHRHTNNRRRFEQLAQRLELGEDYPTDAGKGAHFRPDTSLFRYLNPLMRRFHVLRSEIGDFQFDSLKQEKHWVHVEWCPSSHNPPGEEVLVPLRAALRLPPLTTATVPQWAQKVIVPYILATDAADYANCDEPALQRIAKYKGVKSRATFKSRLLSAVTHSLKRLARPAA